MNEIKTKIENFKQPVTWKEFNKDHIVQNFLITLGLQFWPLSCIVWLKIVGIKN